MLLVSSCNIADTNYLRPTYAVAITDDEFSPGDIVTIVDDKAIVTIDDTVVEKTYLRNGGIMMSGITNSFIYLRVWSQNGMHVVIEESGGKMYSGTVDVPSGYSETKVALSYP